MGILPKIKRYYGDRSLVDLLVLCLLLGLPGCGFVSSGPTDIQHRIPDHVVASASEEIDAFEYQVPSLLSPGPQQASKALESHKLTPEQAEEVLVEAGNNWLYGAGLGRTALNVGTTVVFPPYGIYMLTTGLLSLGGYKDVYVTDLLPEEHRLGWNEAYQGVTAVPGRLVASLAGKEFRDRENSAANLRVAAGLQ